jgi:hypothetical protein
MAPGIVVEKRASVIAAAMPPDFKIIRSSPAVFG